MNKFLCVGNVTKDPAINDAGSMAYFSVAVKKDYKNKETGKYDSDFISFIAFGNSIQYIMSYVRVGDIVCVEAKVENGKKKEGGDYPKDSYIVQKINRIKKGKAHGDGMGGADMF